MLTPLGVSREGKSLPGTSKDEGGEAGTSPEGVLIVVDSEHFLFSEQNYTILSLQY